MLHSATAGKEPPMWLLGGGAHRTKLWGGWHSLISYALCAAPKTVKHKLTQ